MLRSTFLHDNMFRSTCLGFYAMFSHVLSLFFGSRLMIRVIFSHACIALLAMLCSDLCVYVLFAMFCT